MTAFTKRPVKEYTNVKTSLTIKLQKITKVIIPQYHYKASTWFFHQSCNHCFS